MALTPRFEAALIYAAQLHASQVRRKTSIPYLAHLLGVASIALDYGADEDEAIAALLHDAVEDQGGAVTREEIRRCFGDRVVEIVDGCTDSDAVPKPPWHARKEAFLARLPHASSSVRLVSAADKLHNARTILADYRAMGDAVWERFTGGKSGTLWYYRALVDVFRAAGTSPLVEELARVVAELDQVDRQTG